MLFESVSLIAHAIVESVLLRFVTQSKATMSDTDFYSLHRKYCTTDVPNTDNPEECGYRNGGKTNDSPKSPKRITGMQSKGSQKEKFFGKSWRNRSKVIANAGNSLWAPDSKEKYSWCSVGGRKVCLTSLDISDLTGPERLALQQVALTKLRQLNLRSHVTIPKSSRSDKRTSSLKRALSLKSRLAIGNSDKDSGVFAIPLLKAVAQSTPSDIDKKTEKENDDQNEILDNNNETPKARRHSSSSLNQHYPRGTIDGGSSSNRDPPESPTWKSRLIDALTLNSSSASASCILDKQATLSPQPPRVPPIVTQAIEHLENYGLNVLGIFRTGGSKRRMKQMKEQFDSGEKKKFTAEDNPHDVAALFKEYFRDLPEPLLTRELYAAFLETQGVDDKSLQKTLLQLLCCLLPTPNRDTLKALLEFLSKVDFYSEDRVDENAIEIPGNKMNCRNLATLIGPNILHKVKSGHHHDFMVEDRARAEERKEVIDVVEELILNWKDLFVISADLYHEVYLYFLENEPEILDFLLRKKTPTRISANADDIVEFEHATTSKQESTMLQHRCRCRSTGDAERTTSVYRTASAPNTRPPPDYHHHRQRNQGYAVKSTNVTPVRSRSLNQEEGNTFKGKKFMRQLSSPENSQSHSPGSSRNRQKTPPLIPRGNHRFGNGTSEPPSPALSSSFSHSSYSTPPSSPPLTPYFSAESSCSSPVSVSYLGSEGPVVTELGDLLNEVESDLTKERDNEHFNSDGPMDFDNDVPDWQLTRWIQWETITQRRSSKRDAFEQETLV